METVSISIVVPIYNGERYLQKLVGSILPQLSDDVELILVDDGSTDKSSLMCDEFSIEHAQIRTIHKRNGGLCSARNAGIEQARGKYLSFVDVDDYISIGAYAKVLEVIEKYNPDCIDFGWNYVGANGEITEHHHSFPKNVLLDAQTIYRTILPPLVNVIPRTDSNFLGDYVWNKIYKVEIIQKNNVRFDETRRTWEDRPFLVEYLRYCDTFFSIDQHFYNYIYAPGSLSQQYSDDYFRLILANFRLYSTMFGEYYNFSAQYVCQYWSQSIENMVFRALVQSDNLDVTRDIVISTLADPQVRQWFSERNTTTSFEKRITECLSNEQYADAWNYFRREYKNRSMSSWYRKAIQKIRITLHTAIRK